MLLHVYGTARLRAGSALNPSRLTATLYIAERVLCDVKQYAGINAATGL